jgi:uncharacterized protein YkwD
MGLRSRWRLLALVVGLPTALAALLAMCGESRRDAGRSRDGTGVEAADGAAASAAPGACAGPAPQPQRAAFEERVVELVNERRQLAGEPPLKRVEPLTGSARWFAHDMASEDYFPEDHDTWRREGGRLVRTCDWGARLGWYYPRWTSLAENIAAGDETPEQVVAGWLASPAHRASMLGHGYWETGAGYWAGGSKRHYWVQDFGRRTGVFPAVIAGEAGSTSSPRVDVWVYGSWRQMRVRNDDDPFGPWRTFTSSLDWMLRDAPGTRRVTVELRDGGKNASASDVIELTPARPPG